MISLNGFTETVRILTNSIKCTQPTTLVHSVSNTFFLAFFYYPKPGFFQLLNPGILKNLELLLHSNISNSDNTKVADCACNGQINTFELSTIIVRQEVRLLLGHHHRFVVGPFIFSFN